MDRLFRNSGLILTTLVSTTCMISVMANNSAPNEHTGFYVGAGAGAIVSTDILEDAPGYGLGANLGYMINPYIGLEVLYYANPYHVSNSFFDIDYGVLNQIYGGDIKLNLPLGQHFSIFAKGGYGGVSISINATNPINNTTIDLGSGSASGGLVGGGFGYSFNQHSELTLESDGIILSSANDNGNPYYGFIGLVYNYHFN